jgi:uncharacterized membrane protein
MTSAAVSTAPAAVKRLTRASTWTIAVWIGTAVYATALSAESIYRHSRYATGFDTAIYDQLLWLAAHGHDLFSTVVSRPMLGDHFEPGLLLLTPLYWLGLGVPGLLAAQSIGLALTAPALYMLARDRGASPALASLPALLWLASPWTASVNLFDFHPFAFAPVLLVLSVLGALRGQWLLLGVTAAVAMSLKEDIALIYFVLGILLALNGSKRAGAILSGASVLVLVVAREAISANGDSLGTFGKRFAGDRGDSMGDAFVWMAHHPLATISDVMGESGPGTFLLLLATAGLAFLAPRWLLLAVPTLLHNALSDYSIQHSLGVHYHLMVATGLFIAAAIGVKRVAAFSQTTKPAVTGAVTVALATAFLGDVYVHRNWEPHVADRQQIEAALARIPANAPAAAAVRLEPHLSHRIELYTLPEPFAPIDWGSPLTAGEMKARAERVQFVAVIDGGGPNEFKQIDALVPSLLRSGFVQIYREGEIRVLKRK